MGKDKLQGEQSSDCQGLKVVFTKGQHEGVFWGVMEVLYLNVVVAAGLCNCQNSQNCTPKNEFPCMEIKKQKTKVVSGNTKHQIAERWRSKEYT